MFKYPFPNIMGILNVTPDSFSDGGKFTDAKHATDQALMLLDQGADIIDIGGESTRPGAVAVQEKDEIERVIPVVKEIKRLRPNTVISVDTTKYELARQACDLGAEIINDISGLDYDGRLANLAAEFNASIVLMHMSGKPRTMQLDPQYDDVVEDVYNDLQLKIQKARDAGAKKIIADVGIGFGKTTEHNLKLLKHHDRFKALNVPMLLGISRKSLFGAILDVKDPVERDVPTALLHALLLNSGTDIIRVHNIEHITTLKKLCESFENI